MNSGSGLAFQHSYYNKRRKGSTVQQHCIRSTHNLEELNLMHQAAHRRREHLHHGDVSTYHSTESTFTSISMKWEMLISISSGSLVSVSYYLPKHEYLATVHIILELKDVYCHATSTLKDNPTNLF